MQFFKNSPKLKRTKTAVEFKSSLKTTEPLAFALNPIYPNKARTRLQKQTLLTLGSPQKSGFNASNPKLRKDHFSLKTIHQLSSEEPVIYSDSRRGNCCQRNWQIYLVLPLKITVQMISDFKPMVYSRVRNRRRAGNKHRAWKI